MMPTHFIVRRVCLLTLGLAWITESTTPSLVRRQNNKAAPAPAIASLTQDLLNGVLAERLLAVEATVRETYEAFPKNTKGEIPYEGIFGSMVRNYFSRTHGWLIKGLEPPSMRPVPVTEVHEAHILRDRAPGLATALKAQRAAGAGLSLNDVVAVIAAIEHLVLLESLPVAKGAYRLNGWAQTDNLDAGAMHDVLRSYVILFRQGEKRDLKNFRHHTRLKALVRNDTEGWHSLVAFETDMMRDFLRRDVDTNSGERFTFNDARKIFDELTMKFGLYQNAECGAMKNDLMALDKDVSGRVPLDVFHAQPPHPAYQFTESAEYLRKIQALDEAQAGKPNVFIANYVLALSNCIASTEYYSICCLTECTGIMSEIEGRLQKPAAAPDEMLELVRSIAGDNARYHLTKAPDALEVELKSIAAVHDGVVPIHSGGFLMWMHHAFPDECPYPTAGEAAAEESEAVAAERWQAVQEGQCTRIPSWQRSSEHEKNVPEELDFV